jgi:Bacterial PH domain
MGHDARMFGRSGPAGGKPVEVFRSRSVPLLALVWEVVAVVLAVDLLWRGEGRLMVAGLAAIALVTVLVYAVSQRPAVVAAERGVVLRNVVRDVRVPWRLVQRVESDWALTVVTAHRDYTAWAITGRPRRSREDTPARIAGRLSERRDEALTSAAGPAHGGERVEVRPAWPVVGAALLCAVVLLGALVA